MYRTVLIDDEPWALLGMRNTFPWEQYGFRIIAELTDPIAALRIIHEQKPDAVFTDVRMPGMTGLELMKQSREKGIEAEFVIVSGFSEFAYAQEAIRYGGFDYLLKPLEKEETETVLKKLNTRLKLKNPHSASPIIDPDDLEAEINEQFRELLRYVNHHYHEELQLKELASRFHLHFTYCCDLFRKTTKTTFSDYVTRLRLNKACELLQNKTLPIYEISARVGYNDHYYFNKVFKKHHGITPAQFRRRRRV